MSSLPSVYALKYKRQAKNMLAAIDASLAVDHPEGLSLWEAGYIQSMRSQLATRGWAVSNKQVAVLRDIRTKLLYAQRKEE